MARARAGREEPAEGNLFVGSLTWLQTEGDKVKETEGNKGEEAEREGGEGGKEGKEGGRQAHSWQNCKALILTSLCSVPTILPLNGGQTPCD